MVLGNLFAVRVRLGCCSELNSHLIWQHFLGLLDQCLAPFSVAPCSRQVGPVWGQMKTLHYLHLPVMLRTSKVPVMHSFWGWVCARERQDQLCFYTRVNTPSFRHTKLSFCGQELLADLICWELLWQSVLTPTIDLHRGGMEVPQLQSTGEDLGVVCRFLLLFPARSTCCLEFLILKSMCTASLGPPLLFPK